MTVAALASKIDYLENGVTVDFAVPFRFLAGTITASRVLADGTVAALVAGSDFTMTGGGTDAGGTLTLTGASISGATLRIRRVTSRTQQVVYVDGDTFPATSHEQALDRAMLVDQEQDDKIADTALRALLVPDGETAPAVQAASARGGRFPLWSPDGSELLSSSGTGNDPDLRTDLANQDDDGLGGGLVVWKPGNLYPLHSLARKGAEFPSWCDWEVDGSGTEADHDRMQAALTACQGGALFVPPANWIVNTDAGPLNQKEVRLYGSGVHDGSTNTLNAGSILLIKGPDNPAFSWQRGSRMEGLMAAWPDQVTSATPAVFAPFIDCDPLADSIQHCGLDRMVILNAYTIFRASSAGGSIGHIDFTNIVMCAIHRGWEIANNLEHIRFNNINATFGHWLAADGAAIEGYIRDNAVLIEYGDGDGLELTNMLAYGFNKMLLGDGQNISNLTLANIFADNVLYPLYVNGGEGVRNLSWSDVKTACFNRHDSSKIGCSITIKDTTMPSELTIGGASIFGQCGGNHIFVDTDAEGFMNIGADVTFQGAGDGKAAVDPFDSRPWASAKIYAPNMVIKDGGAVHQGQGSELVSGYEVNAVNRLEIGNASFRAQYNAVKVHSAGAVHLDGNVSVDTVGDFADDISGVAGSIHNRNNWDKQQGKSTATACCVRNGVATSISSGSFADIPFAIEDFDRGANFSSATFTATKAGLHRFLWLLTHDTSGTLNDRFAFQLLATRAAGNKIIPVSYKMLTIDYNSVDGSGFFDLAIGDTVKLQGRRAGGSGAFTLLNDPDYNWLSGELVS